MQIVPLDSNKAGEATADFHRIITVKLVQYSCQTCHSLIHSY